MPLWAKPYKLVLNLALQTRDLTASRALHKKRANSRPLAPKYVKYPAAAKKQLPVFAARKPAI